MNRGDRRTRGAVAEGPLAALSFEQAAGQRFVAFDVAICGRLTK
jgi:hypothetical protein